MSSSIALSAELKMTGTLLNGKTIEKLLRKSLIFFVFQPINPMKLQTPPVQKQCILFWLCKAIIWIMMTRKGISNNSELG